MRAVHRVSVSAPTTVTRLALRVGQGTRNPGPTQAVVEVRWQTAHRGRPAAAAGVTGSQRSGTAPMPSPPPSPPQIFPLALLSTGAINTGTIKTAMGGSGNCQQTFVVPQSPNDGYVSIRLPGTGCPITAAGNYAIALRVASSSMPTTYACWAVGSGNGATPLPGGVWTYLGFSTWTPAGGLTAPTPSDFIGSLQITATD